MRGALLLLVVVPGAAYPNYVGCDLKVSTAGEPWTTDNGGLDRTLTAESKLMDGQLKPTKSITINLKDTDGKDVTRYTKGASYTVEVNGGNPVGAIDHVSHGTLASGSGATQLCDTQQYILGGAAKSTYTWTAPVAEPADGVQITHIRAASGSGNQFIVRYILYHDKEIDTDPFKQGFEEVKAITCRNKTLIGSKDHERYMISGFLALWILCVHITNHPKRPSRIMLALSVALAALLVTFSATDKIPNMPLWLAAMAYLAISAYLLFKDKWSFLRGLWKWFWISMVYFTAMSSFHHWCNGEQDWDNNEFADWGDFDSWQIVIPWWAGVHFVAVWSVYARRPKHWKIQYQVSTAALVVWAITIAAKGVKGRGVAYLTMGLVAIVVAPMLVAAATAKRTRKFASLQVQFLIVAVSTIASVAAATTATDGYIDVSTVFQMVCSAIVGVTWGISSIATANANAPKAAALDNVGLSLMCTRDSS